MLVLVVLRCCVANVGLFVFVLLIFKPIIVLNAFEEMLLIDLSNLLVFGQKFVVLLESSEVFRLNLSSQTTSVGR